MAKICTDAEMPARKRKSSGTRSNAGVALVAPPEIAGEGMTSPGDFHFKDATNRHVVRNLLGTRKCVKVHAAASRYPISQFL